MQIGWDDQPALIEGVFKSRLSLKTVRLRDLSQYEGVYPELARVSRD